MEKFETQVRKYRREIDHLAKSNAVLAKKAAAGEKESFSKQLETAQLQADYHNLSRFVDSLPEEVKRQARASQRSQDYQR